MLLLRQDTRMQQHPVRLQFVILKSCYALASHKQSVWNCQSFQSQQNFDVYPQISLLYHFKKFSVKGKANEKENMQRGCNASWPILQQRLLRCYVCHALSYALETRGWAGQRPCSHGVSFLIGDGRSQHLSTRKSLREGGGGECSYEERSWLRAPTGIWAWGWSEASVTGWHVDSDLLSQS